MPHWRPHAPQPPSRGQTQGQDRRIIYCNSACARRARTGLEGGTAEVPVASFHDSLCKVSREACSHSAHRPWAGWAPAELPSSPPASIRHLQACARAGQAERGRQDVRTASTCSSCSRARPRPVGSVCAACAAGSHAPACRRHPLRPGDKGLAQGRPAGLGTPATGSSGVPAPSLPTPTSREPGLLSSRPQGPIRHLLLRSSPQSRAAPGLCLLLSELLPCP